MRVVGTFRIMYIGAARDGIGMHENSPLPTFGQDMPRNVEVSISIPGSNLL